MWISRGTRPACFDFIRRRLVKRSYCSAACAGIPPWRCGICRLRLFPASACLTYYRTQYVRSLVTIVLDIQANRTGSKSFVHKNPSLIIDHFKDVAYPDQQHLSEWVFLVDLVAHHQHSLESFQSFRRFPQWSPRPRSVSSF